MRNWLRFKLWLARRKYARALVEHMDILDAYALAVDFSGRNVHEARMAGMAAEDALHDYNFIQTTRSLAEASRDTTTPARSV